MQVCIPDRVANSSADSPWPFLAFTSDPRGLPPCSLAICFKAYSTTSALWLFTAAWRMVLPSLVRSTTCTPRAHYRGKKMHDIAWKVKMYTPCLGLLCFCMLPDSANVSNIRSTIHVKHCMQVLYIGQETKVILCTSSNFCTTSRWPCRAATYSGHSPCSDCRKCTGHDLAYKQCKSNHTHHSMYTCISCSESNNYSQTWNPWETHAKASHLTIFLQGFHFNCAKSWKFHRGTESCCSRGWPSL